MRSRRMFVASAPLHFLRADRMRLGAALRRPGRPDRPIRNWRRSRSRRSRSAIGQSLALRLRQWLNPTGAPVPSRYLLRTVLQISRLDLGVLTFGLGTRARLDVCRKLHADRDRHQHSAAHGHAAMRPSRSISSPITIPMSLPRRMPARARPRRSVVTS